MTFELFILSTIYTMVSYSCDYMFNENIESVSENSMQNFLSECITNNFVGNQLNITLILLYLQNRLEINPENIYCIMFHTSSQNN